MSQGLQTTLALLDETVIAVRVSKIALATSVPESSLVIRLQTVADFENNTHVPPPPPAARRRRALVARFSTSSTTGTTTTSATTYASPVTETLQTQACNADAVILHVSIESEDEESRNRFSAVLALASSLSATLSDGTSVCSATTVTQSSETVEGYDPPVEHEEHRLELNEWLVLVGCAVAALLGCILTTFGLARIFGFLNIDDDQNDAEEEDAKKRKQDTESILDQRQYKKVRFVI